jgi:hypothetical protein
VSGNTATFDGGGINNGGRFGGHAALRINNSTLSGNSANPGGAIYNTSRFGGTATLDIGNTILNSGSTGGTLFNDGGTVTSHGYNLSSDDAGGNLNGPGDQINTDPLLGPLQDNGGPTFTHELLPGSPAIDAGDPNFTPPPFFDQRGPGYPRVVNGRIDKGSFEVQPQGPVVTNTNDSGPGSLRQALSDAHDGDSITFAITGTIGLTTGELLVDKSITISGPGANTLTVSRNSAAHFRIFHVNPGHTVTVNGLTISNGNPQGNFPDSAGGGIYSERSALTVNSCVISGNLANFGGGLFSYGNAGAATLHVSNCTLIENSGFNSGGAIENYGEGAAGTAALAVSDSTLSGNSAGDAAGIDNVGFDNATATATFTNSTLSGNVGTVAGGIDTFASDNAIATVTITNSTLSGNSTQLKGKGGGAITVSSGSLILGNTVLKTGKLGDNIVVAFGATLTSLGYSLSDDNAGGFLTGPGDQVNTDPLLGPLQDNGGPTFTHELLPGSPAIDAGDPNFTPPPFFDQRGPGFNRVVNGRIDKGSFEVQGSTPTPTPTPTLTATPTATATAITTATVTATPTTTPTATVTVTATPTTTPTATPTAAATVTPTPRGTPTPRSEPTPRGRPTPPPRP